MGGIDEAVGYTILGLVFVVLIFVGALVFVRASRRGNRRFKWWRAQAPQGSTEPVSPPSRSRDS
jgi:hypothetical protein